MRRLFLIPVMVAATCAALIPATGASAKPPAPAITGIVGSSTGSVGSFCEFGFVVTYSGHAKHGDTVNWTFLHADGSKVFGGAPPSEPLGPSPFTTNGLAVTQGTNPSMPAGSYIIDVQLLANGSVVSEQHTSPFTMSGLPAPSGCPPVGQLATYPIPVDRLRS